MRAQTGMKAWRQPPAPRTTRPKIVFTSTGRSSAKGAKSVKAAMPETAARRRAASPESRGATQRARRRQRLEGGPWRSAFAADTGASFTFPKRLLKQLANRAFSQKMGPGKDPTFSRPWVWSSANSEFKSNPVHAVQPTVSLKIMAAYSFSPLCSNIFPHTSQQA